MLKRLLVITMVISFVWCFKNMQVNAFEENVQESTAKEDCQFCNESKLTNRQKCEELLVKMLTDEQNWLDEGIITKEVYELQIVPFNKALNYLEVASDEDANSLYVEMLFLNLDWLEEDKAAGEQIDQAFYTYIEEELNRMM